MSALQPCDYLALFVHAGVIKQDIQAMNAAIADLQTVSAGSSYDANKQSADHSHVVVDSLRTQLKVWILDFRLAERVWYSTMQRLVNLLGCGSTCVW